MTTLQCWDFLELGINIHKVIHSIMKRLSFSNIVIHFLKYLFLVLFHLSAGYIQLEFASWNPHSGRRESAVTHSQKLCTSLKDNGNKSRNVKLRVGWHAVVFNKSPWMILLFGALYHQVWQWRFQHLLLLFLHFPNNKNHFSLAFFENLGYVLVILFYPYLIQVKNFGILISL